MHQPHFLLSASASARALALRDVFAMTEDQAFELFREDRWGAHGNPVCPDCGVADQHWFLPSRQQWRCRACGHPFSVTSGAIFADHKLPLQTYLEAILIYTNAVKGLSALQLGRDLESDFRPRSFRGGCPCSSAMSLSNRRASAHRALFMLMGLAGYLPIAASSRAQHTETRGEALLRQSRAGRRGAGPLLVGHPPDHPLGIQFRRMMTG